jgi:CDP-glycerol glycerophosphotransferase
VSDVRWSRREKAPVLSVVVPVYNVEPWLDACLDSILAQPLRELEVILVDDGSSDGSVAIASRRAAADPRVRLHRHDANAGLSAARNTGVALATAPYLTFVDSDDTLPPDAWGPALRSLKRTGSDFSVGKAVRVAGERRFVTPLMERNHRVDRPALRIEEAPLLLADVFAWNKVFRRSFWDDADLTFPPGMLYEDQPAMTRAFLAARSFDVLAAEVYEWAVRDDAGSISQRRGELRNLEHRRATKLDSLEQVRAHGSPVVLEVFLRDVLPIDMWEHFRAAVAGPRDRWDTAYWDVLRDMQTRIWNADTLPFGETSVPARQRAMGALVEQDRREDLRALIDEIDAGTAHA